MNVGFVVYGDIETTSGGFFYDRKLIEGLRERGDTVAVIELPWPSYAHGLFGGAVRRVRGLGDEFDSVGSFDVLVQDELAHPTLVSANAGLRRRFEGPIVSIVHHLRCSEAHPRPETALYRAVEQRYLRSVDAAICNSAFTRETVTDLAPLATTVVPPAGDRFDPAIDAATITERAQDGPLRVVFLGSVVPRKGLHTLIEALARLPDERWRLTIVGDVGTNPAYTRRVRRTASRLGVRDRIETMGTLPDGDLEACLRENHVLAIPSTHEGFGIAYLEGMSFGLPALATTAGGAREVVTHGETGFLCAPGDVGDLARWLRGLVEDRTLLAELGVAACERYDAHPSWADSAAQVGAFLDRVVASEVPMGSITDGDGNDGGGGDDSSDGHDGEGSDAGEVSHAVA